MEGRETERKEEKETEERLKQPILNEWCWGWVDTVNLVYDGLFSRNQWFQSAQNKSKEKFIVLACGNVFLKSLTSQFLYPEFLRGIFIKKFYGQSVKIKEQKYIK